MSTSEVPPGTVWDYEGRVIQHMAAADAEIARLKAEVEQLRESRDDWRKIATDLDRGTVEVSDGDVDNWLAAMRSGNKVLFGHPQANGLADYIEALRQAQHSGD